MLRGHRRFIVLCYTAKLRGFREEGRDVVQGSLRGCQPHKDVFGDGHSGMADDLLLALLRLND
jgi:hypothetical protein